MSRNTALLTLLAVGICWSSVAQARTYHHRNVARKEAETISENAELFTDMPELLAELWQGENESRLHKRQIRQADVPLSRYDIKYKEAFIEVYAEATIAHSDKRDRALMREMMQTARQWEWHSYADFKKYADKIFDEVKGRHENDIN